MTHLF